MGNEQPIRYDDGAHWYEQDGTPRYEAGMKEARLEDLVPGQSTVTSQLAKPGLEIWKLNQLLLSALTLEQNDGEPLAAYAERIAEDYRQEAEVARDKGHQIHELLKTCIVARTENGPESPLPPVGDDPIFDLILHAYEWIDQNVISGEAEQGVISLDYGHAGTLDFLGYLDDEPDLLTLIDWKSQNVKRSYKRGPRDTSIEYEGDTLPQFNFYEAFPMQLGSYRQAVTERLKRQSKAIDVGTLASPETRWTGPWKPGMSIRVASGMISVNPDHPGFAVKWWDEQEIADAYSQGFLPLLSVWRWKNNFPYNRKVL